MMLSLNADALSAVVDAVESSDLLPLALSCKTLLDACVVRAEKTGWWTKATSSVGRLMWAVDDMHATPKESWFYTAVDDGCLSVFLQLMTQYSSIPYKLETFTLLAVRSGHLDILQWLHNNNMLTLSKHAMYLAAPHGSSLISWLRERKCPWNEYACENVAKYGDLSTLQWLRAQDPPCPWSEKDMFISVIEGGCIPMFEWLKKQCLWKEEYALDYSFCEVAAVHGHLSALQWLRSQIPRCPWHESIICISAVSTGNIALLEWLRSQTNANSWAKACNQANHICVMQWLRSQHPPCPWSERTCAKAAQKGNLELLQWLRGQNPPCPWDASVCARAAESGHIPVLQWLRAQTPPCDWNANACLYAAKNGKVDVLNWLLTQDPPCPWDEEECNKQLVERSKVEMNSDFKKLVSMMRNL